MSSARKARKRYPCDCCGFLTFFQPPNGSYDICPVCFWEDDPTQHDDPALAGGANTTSLNEARQNFTQYGSCDRGGFGYVRIPKLVEIPRGKKWRDLAWQQRNILEEQLASARLATEHHTHPQAIPLIEAIAMSILLILMMSGFMTLAALG